MTTQQKIAAMQTKCYTTPRADVYQADDGTWGHCMTFGAGFGTKEAAQTDLRFCKDWAK